MVDEAGISIANTYISIYALTHLYNVLHRLKVAETYWPELERVIELHRGDIFANEVSTTSLMS
jgi:hypothetical protein